MGCLNATLVRIGGATVSVTRVGGMVASLDLVCGTGVNLAYLRVSDDGFVLTVDGGYIILNEPNSNI